jgi:hypothetical protein
MMSPRNGAILLMIATAGLWRLVFTGFQTPLESYTPMGAIALFGGCYFADKWKAYLVPLLTFWLTDMIINSILYYHKLTVFYPGFYWTYGSFALMVTIGSLIRKVDLKTVLIACISASLMHWVITDFGTWLGDGMYAKTWTGFVACYTFALPFLQKMLIANLVFSGVMFGAFELAKKRFPVLALN